MYMCTNSVYAEGSHLSNCLTIRTRIGTCRPDQLAHIVVNLLNHLTSSELQPAPAVHDVDLMAHALQLIHDGLINAVLQVDLRGGAFWTDHAGADAEARGIESVLDREAMVEDVQQHLKLTLRLHEASHDA